jgi:hypothetical protein
VNEKPGCDQVGRLKRNDAREGRQKQRKTMETNHQTEMEQTNTAAGENAEAVEYRGAATYSPEDNKLRLYVGRVPRDEYLKLKAEGWQALHKQRETGGGDFAAVWTPERRDTALSYAGVIEDEDKGPAERAAERAERFGGYRDKRAGEAGERADRFEAGPSAHGFQNQARAERAAARHDRIVGRAVDAWSKAEYWQSRTAGVISNALHLSSPGVRMGRIKELEADIRRCEKSREEYRVRFARWTECAAMTDAGAQKERAYLLARMENGEYKHPRTGRKAGLYSFFKDTVSFWNKEAGEWQEGPPQDPLTGAELCALWLAHHGAPAEEGPWLTHYRLRLAYENQMLEAQGGRAAFVEMEVGGWILGSRRAAGQWLQIRKVNKSNATGRVVSVEVRAMVDLKYNNETRQYDRGLGLVMVKVERLSPDSYRAPTDEERAAFLEALKDEKAAKKAKAPAAPPLINPTDEDAEKLVTLWNDRRRGEWERRHTPAMREYYPLKLSTVIRTTQAVYSAKSKGACARAETLELCSLGREDESSFCDYAGQAKRKAERGPVVCKIRITGYDPRHVLIITDKPQKTLPASVWVPYVAPVSATAETVNA